MTVTKRTLNARGSSSKAKTSRIDAMATNFGDIIDEVSQQLKNMRK